MLEFFVAACIVLIIGLPVLYLVLYTFYMSGPVGWITAVCTICVIIYLVIDSVCTSNEESKKNAKTIQKKICDIRKSNIVFIESSKSYAIPLHVSIKEIVLLHPTLVNSYKPSVGFSETKHLPSDVVLISRIPKDSGFYSISQISSIAKDLYLNVDPQNKDLESKLTELKRLEKLAKSSVLYKQQADLYSRAANQVQGLLDIGQKLSLECHTFILDILIGQELAKYNTNDLPDILAIRMSLDNRCKLVSDQYQLLKSEMEEYINLKNGV
jgi:hypothetical protein